MIQSFAHAPGDRMNTKEWWGTRMSAPNWFYATGSVCFLMGTLLNAWRAR